MEEIEATDIQRPPRARKPRETTQQEKSQAGQERRSRRVSGFIILKLVKMRPMMLHTKNSTSQQDRSTCAD
ncbi:hypothetical protein AMECASPLE_014247 [Ameca splendens]|uniref:Uncharacterized protein n=1 Tax=Ameca splendens TaxID=208324 RepID=A0ABV0Z0B2_9TELE